MRLNYKRTILIGLAFMSILALWQFYDQVIPYLLENVFGLQTFTANAIMSVDNVLVIFMLLWYRRHRREICRLGAYPVGWTFQDQTALDDCRQAFGTYIFEGFLPREEE